MSQRSPAYNQGRSNREAIGSAPFHCLVLKEAQRKARCRACKANKGNSFVLSDPGCLECSDRFLFSVTVLVVLGLQILHT
jgi:hypothetical protein